MAGVKQVNFELLFEKFPQLMSQHYLLQNISHVKPENLLELYSHPEVIRYIDMPPLQSLKDAQKYLINATEYFNLQQKVIWAVCSKEQNNLLGVIRLYGINKEHHYANIGFELNRNYWGKGIISESLTTVLNFLFSQVQFNRIEAQTFVGNQRSIKLLERLGFVNEGRLHQNFLINNHYEDSYMYAKLNQF